MKTMTKRLIRIAPMVALAMLLLGCDFLGWFDVGDVIAATNGNSGDVIPIFRVACVQMVVFRGNRLPEA